MKSGLPILLFAIALAVAAVPEALAAIVTGALAIAMHEMAKRNALVRKMPAVETLGCTSVICSDKTGTLTKGEMTVRKLHFAGRTVEVSGAGYSSEGSVDAPTDDPGLQLLLQAGVLASDAVIGQDGARWFVKGDPTEGALVVAATKGGFKTEETRRSAPRVEEFPFSSERKRMTTIHCDAGRTGRRFHERRARGGAGAMRIVSERQRNRAAGRRASGRSCWRSTNRWPRRRCACSASRTRSCRGRIDMPRRRSRRIWCSSGYVGMMDPPREEAVEAVRVCRQVSIRPVMITGDHKLTAVAVAKEVGIFREGDSVLTGEELSKMDEAALAAVVEKVTVYARVSPMDKLKIVRAWKDKGHVVAMTGDGVNDAPALKHADIGVAMGISGTDVAKESADIVLADDNFATIVKAIERGRWIYDNIQKYLTYLLRANITEVVVLGGVVMYLGPAYLPLLPAAILYINLASDGLPALALGIAPPDKDIMQRPPRDPNESVFSFDVRTFILFGAIDRMPDLPVGLLPATWATSRSRAPRCS